MRTQVPMAELVAELAADGAVAAVAHDERVTTAVDGVAHVQDDGVLAAWNVNALARVEEGRDGAPVAAVAPCRGCSACSPSVGLGSRY